MSAREAILARVRAASGPAVAVRKIAGEAAALVPDLDLVRPSLPDGEAVQRFVEKATSDRVTATVERLAIAEALPVAVQRYLEVQDLGNVIAAALPPRLAGLDWGALELKDTIERNEPVALTYAEAAVAETGTLVFSSSAVVPMLFNFVALHHLAVVRVADVVPYLEDAFGSYAGQPMPRGLCLVTGTSGTADIEGKNIRGAHGPRHLHIYLVDD